MKYLVYSVILVFNFACSGLYEGSSSERRQKTANAPEETLIYNPTLEINESVENCENNDLCYLDDIEEIYEYKDSNIYNLPYIIRAETEALLNKNIENSPILKFRINGIEKKDILNVSYSYIKKAQDGNIIIQSGDFSIYQSGDNTYSIYLNAEKLGSGIINSYPYELHILKIKINDTDNNQFIKEIHFKLSSNKITPIEIYREIAESDLPYYTNILHKEAEQTIDIIKIKNKLPVNIKLSGSITIENQTIAEVNEQKSIQSINFVPKSSNYPYDRYLWEKTSSNQLKYAKEIPSLIAIVHYSESIQTELPVIYERDNEKTIMTFENIDILSEQDISIEIIALFEINNHITGDFGSKLFLDGYSHRNNINIEHDTCEAFYTMPDCGSSIECAIIRTVAKAHYMIMESQQYPDCEPGILIDFKSLSIVSYPEFNNTLTGRYHKTLSSISAQVWIQNYDEWGKIQKVSKTLEPLLFETGISSTMDNNTFAYSGFAPGIVQ